MNRLKFLKKATVGLLVIGMSAALFAGCQSNNTSTASQTSSTNTNTQSGRKRLSPDEMKKQIQDEIQPLITAKTITQDQANKIVDAMTTRSNPSGGNQQSNNQQSNNSQGSQQSGGQNNGQRQRFNPLSKLVSDGTITQAQADAVMQKVRGNFARGGNRNGNGNGNGQGSQNSNGQTSSSN